MRIGGTWRGRDFTDYVVVKPQDVRHDQPRWWVDEPPADGDPMLGPAHPGRLHLYPAAMCGEVQFALVLAS